jgi:hypothetical protein
MTQPTDDYLTPHEASERLWHLATALEKHGVPAKHIEALQLISQRFTRHLNGLAAFSDRLHGLAEGFLC